MPPAGYLFPMESFVQAKNFDKAAEEFAISRSLCDYQQNIRTDGAGGAY